MVHSPDVHHPCATAEMFNSALNRWPRPLPAKAIRTWAIAWISPAERTDASIGRLSWAALFSSTGWG